MWPAARTSDLLDALRFAHVLFSAVALGTNVSFPIWTRLAERDGGSLVFTLRAVRWVDRWVTIPAYLLSAVSGIALVPIERIDPRAIWVAGSVALFVALMGLGFLLYRPVSRLRLAAAVRGRSDAAYRGASRQADLLDAAIIGAALAILFLMVARPS